MSSFMEFPMTFLVIIIQKERNCLAHELGYIQTDLKRSIKNDSLSNNPLIMLEFEHFYLQRAGQIDMNMQSDLMAAFEETL